MSNKKKIIGIIVLVVLIIAVTVTIILIKNNSDKKMKDYEIEEIAEKEYKYFILYANSKYGVMDTNGNILETGKLNFNNLTELVETSNTLGRRMEFSVVGNQQPNIDPTEIDAAKAEEVIVMGPFGTRAPTLYAVLGISICAILITGVVIIKKKVLK